MTYELQVENIKCGGCANSIKHGLLKRRGVEDVQVDIEKGIIKVEANEHASLEAIIDKLREMGYPEPGKGSALTTATSFVSCMIGRVTS
jgi:copper chaperone